ncbi:serine/threonine phosphatase [Erwinia sp. OLTSP20]|uniref:PP2C family protein-serine/threonine phosphatase n=1 Tax=unclassified Erwinia TaxID=2622719 RepID=UPI000C18613A|nr:MULTISPECIES: protein phosphatase 2C domain-containing protein [unclassified Erwinia]PIJ49973.1 serine/threonine phosphatase [Erwinia sp. OAMSP11]PIJ71379.1 serine/threonine phosphatase [Erwinia sp. OLSSP12]PIJ80614.1 serine/threonine phosphatase [Erwinia sp. OLCASP19]PIJ82790.1 serine/threonine phosphatase [Erwinia sp. OLMTSP26]PIJ85475.1 serine/threonine phosphatase [Erwinia sp. OLMDSP33]
MKITFATTSETGNRASNQDRLATFVGQQCAGFIVCDGVAGVSGGETAARLACEALYASLSEDRAITPQQTVNWLADINQLILHEQQNNPALHQMSTTLASLFIDCQQLQAWWAHAGDSRVYHFRRGQAQHITRDHSLQQQFQDAGFENPGINTNLLYNALGTGTAHPASISEVLTLEDGDVFLVCSDGFWRRLSQAEMEQALRMVTSPEEWLALMMQAAAGQQKQDNLSAVAIWMGSPQDITLLQSIADSARFLPPRH